MDSHLPRIQLHSDQYMALLEHKPGVQVLRLCVVCGTIKHEYETCQIEKIYS
jgi:hypothetical protein